MDFEVLFSGDEGIYIVKKGNFFYTVDIDEDIKPLRSEYVETFLKFGGFEIIEHSLSDEVLNKIKAVLNKYCEKLI